MAPLRLVIALALSSILATGCANTHQVDAEGAGDSRPAGAWRKLPSPPLSPRTDAVVIGLARDLLVVGGWEYLCPPMADCSGPETTLEDGAVYDPVANTWSPITPPPFPVRARPYATATLGDSAYLLSWCGVGASACGARPRLLAYDQAADRWTDHGAVPGRDDYLRLVAVGDDLLVYSDSDEGREAADHLFDTRRGAWSELPDDPLPSVFDRFIVAVGDTLVLGGSSRAALDSGTERGKLLAKYDVGSRTWTRLPDAPAPGYQLLATDSGLLLNGHMEGRRGWLLDGSTWEWSRLPGQADEEYDLAGVIGRDHASYVMESGFSPARVYVPATGRILTIPSPPRRKGFSVFDQSVGAWGRDLVVYGGQRWPEDSLRGGELVGDLWVWSPPKM